MPGRGFRDLKVWQVSMDLVETVYRLSADFPKSEQFGLASQIRRAATSVPSNIAEGSGRESSKEFLQFLAIAKGSLREVETQFLIATRLHYLDQIQTDCLLNLISEVAKMLNGLMTSLKTRLKNSF
jgi:four helix bundle protein